MCVREKERERREIENCRALVCVCVDVRVSVGEGVFQQFTTRAQQTGLKGDNQRPSVMDISLRLQEQPQQQG